MTLLFEAARAGNLEMVERLVRAAPWMINVEVGRMTPLSVATITVGARYVAIARVLLAHGADPFFRDAHTRQTLMHAAAVGNVELIPDLAARGLDINDRVNDAHVTPLELAVLNVFAHDNIEPLIRHGGRAARRPDSLVSYMAAGTYLQNYLFFLCLYRKNRLVLV